MGKKNRKLDDRVNDWQQNKKKLFIQIQIILNRNKLKVSIRD